MLKLQQTLKAGAKIHKFIIRLAPAPALASALNFVKSPLIQKY